MFAIMALLCTFIPIYLGNNQSTLQIFGKTGMALLMSIIILFVVIMIGKQRAKYA